MLTEADERRAPVLRCVFVIVAHPRPSRQPQLAPEHLGDEVLAEGLGARRAWYHGASTLRGLTHVAGFDPGEALALEIAYAGRTVPYVVVSTEDGSPALAGLDGKLAYDLTGIANVFAADEAASWALTDTLRKPLSCYSGAVRVYWPGCHVNDNPFRHPLWTAARLGSLDDDEHQAQERFRRRLRQLIMRASAVSVVRPREIDEIRNAAVRADFASVKAQAKSLADFEALADSYAADNDGLRKELVNRDDEIAMLQGEVARLESEREGVIYHLKQARRETTEGAGDDDGVEPDLGEEDAREDGPPTAGDVRFYKKRYAAPTHDVMVPWATAVTTAGRAQRRPTRPRRESRSLRAWTPNGCFSTAGNALVEASGGWSGDARSIRNLPHVRNRRRPAEPVVRREADPEVGQIALREATGKLAAVVTRAEPGAGHLGDARAVLAALDGQHLAARLAIHRLADPGCDIPHEVGLGVNAVERAEMARGS